MEDNEDDRFRYAGHLWRETDPKKVKKVLQNLVKNNVAWDPTFVIYEATRDLLRAKNQPWFKDYLHPAVEDFFRPNPKHHGSFQWNWTTSDEIFWRENYKIWMKAVKQFSEMGGVVGAGEDAGYIYMLYGFSLIRELELHQEAGFHPIDVIQNATGNNAKIMASIPVAWRTILRKSFLFWKTRMIENNDINHPQNISDPALSEYRAVILYISGRSLLECVRTSSILKSLVISA